MMDGPGDGATVLEAIDVIPVPEQAVLVEHDVAKVKVAVPDMIFVP